MGKYLVSLSALAFVVLPVVASAAFTNFSESVTTIEGWINSLIPLLIGIAVLVFLWGVVKYVTAGDDAEKRKAGGALMAYGILAIFVMISVWGLVNILVDTFSLDNTAPTEVPTVPDIP